VTGKQTRHMNERS